MDLDVVKGMMLEYKSTQDSKLFERILLNVDVLLKHFFLKDWRTYSYLRTVDAQDLYQSSVLAVQKTCMGLKESTPPHQLPGRIRGYMRKQFEQEYRHFDKEIASSDQLEDTRFVTPSEELDLIMDLEHILDCKELSNREKRVLYFHLIEQISLRDIAIMECRTIGTVSYDISTIRKKVRRLAKQDNISLDIYL